MNTQAHEIELFDRLLDDLITDPDVPSPLANDFDAETLALTRRMVRFERSDPAGASCEQAQSRVWRHVLANSPASPLASEHSSGWRTRLDLLARPRLMRAGLTLATLVFVVAASLFITTSQPTTVSAQEILGKAQGTLNSPSAAGLQSFVLTETQRTAPGNLRMNAYAGLKADESLSIEVQRWYRAPNQWRSDYVQTVVSADGRQIRSDRSTQMSDGQGLWQYDQASNQVTIDPVDPHMDAKGIMGLYGQSADTLQQLFQQVSTCFDPRVTGSETLAGRATYVVDLGATKCPSASGPEMQGRLVIWVDKETFLVLKLEQHNRFDDKVIMTDQVTSVQYNAAVDSAHFNFTPPAGATIVDNRPKPALNSVQLKQQLGQLSKQVGFPLFVPAYVPSGLAPRAPQRDPRVDDMVEVSYLPTNEPDPDSLASRAKGLFIRQVRTTSSVAENMLKGTDPITINGANARVRRGDHNSGTESALLVERDGVVISISSFMIAPEELLKVAASLEIVPGSR